MKGSTQPMKKLLSFIPTAYWLVWLSLIITLVVLSSCTNDKAKGYCGAEYYNVQYQFNYDDMDYDVYVDKDQYKVKPSNLYTVYVLEYHHYKKEDNNGNVVASGTVENLFYTNTLELFVFVIK